MSYFYNSYDNNGNAVSQEIKGFNGDIEVTETGNNFWFGKVDLAILWDKIFSNTDKVLFALFCVLAIQMQGAKWRTCQITVGSLAHLLGRDKRTVRRSLNVLINRGVIVREPQFDFVNGICRQIKSRFVILGCQSTCYTESDRQGFYFAKVAKSVLIDTNLTVEQKMLFMAMCGMADTVTNDVTTYVRTIAEKIGQSVSSVYRNLSVLKKNGILDITHRFLRNTNGLSASSYSISSPKQNEGGGCHTCEEVLAPVSPLNNRTYYSRQNTTDKSALAYTSAKGTHLPNIQQPCSTHIDSETKIPNLEGKNKAKHSNIASLSDAPIAMVEVIEYMFKLTGRTMLYKSEIKALNSLNEHDTPDRIREEINRAAERFISKGKSLKQLFFGYIWGSLKKQDPTFNPYCTEDEANKAEIIIAENRAEERVKREERKARRQQAQKLRAQQAQMVPDWVNPVSESKTSEIEAQKIIANLEQEPIFQETAKNSQALLVQVQQTEQNQEKGQTIQNTSVPVTARASAQTPQTSLEQIPNKTQVLEYLIKTFPDEEVQKLYSNTPHQPVKNAREILENTLKGMSPDEAQSYLQRIWNTKAQTKCCENCQGLSLSACPYNGVKHELFPLLQHAFPLFKRQISFYIGNEKCTKHLELEQQKQYLQAFIRNCERSGLTLAQCSYTFDKFQTEGLGLDVANAKAEALKAVKNQSWLLLSGKSGTGKTHLAIAIALCIAQRGNAILFRTATGMLNELWTGYQDHTFNSRLQRLLNIPCLVIDEIGKERASQGTTKALFEIINYRYVHGLQTIFTSNLTPEQLVARNPELYMPLFSRLSEKGSWCAVTNAQDQRAIKKG